jgi:hypothetical protein
MISVRLSPALAVARAASLAAGLPAMILLAGCGSQPSSAPGASHPARPVLGRLSGGFSHGTGFGSAEPPRIFNGGDPTGLVSKIRWSGWGGPRATGSGLAEYIGPGQSVATGHQIRATVVAFHLGRCHGTLMYQAVEWFFPQHGQSFSPVNYENVCAGTFHGTH